MGVGLEGSEVHPIPNWPSRCLLLVHQDINSQLLFQNHGCLSAAMLSATMVMDSLSETASPQ